MSAIYYVRQTRSKITIILCTVIVYAFLNPLTPALPQDIGIYTVRHLGMDSCQAILPDTLRVNANLFHTDLYRDPEAMDGNAKYIGVFWIDEMCFLYCIHIPVSWIPAIHAGMTARGLV